MLNIKAAVCPCCSFRPFSHCHDTKKLHLRQPYRTSIALAPDALCRHPAAFEPRGSAHRVQSNSVSRGRGREEGGRTAHSDREQKGKVKRRQGGGGAKGERWPNAIKHVVLTSFSCLLIPHYAANKPRLTFCHLQSC